MNLNNIQGNNFNQFIEDCIPDTSIRNNIHNQLNFGNLNNDKPKMCTYCGGKGTYLGMGEEACGGCAGTGRDTKSDLWAEPCRTCNGRGKVYYCRDFTCKKCNGSGFLQ